MSEVKSKVQRVNHYYHRITRMIPIKNNPKLDCIKTCEICGSQYDLTKHHDREPHKNRYEKKDNHTIILCKTCHYEVDYKKNQKCYFKAQEKQYSKAMSRANL